MYKYRIFRGSLKTKTKIKMRESIIKIISVIIVPFSIVFIITYMLLLFSNTRSKLDIKIAELQTINKVMAEQNKKWSATNDSLKIQISTKDAKLESLQKRDAELFSKLQSINNQITNLTGKYEKADNFTSKYNADSVKQYFSNLK